MYLVFNRMPGISYIRRLGSLLLRLCDVIRALINSLVFRFDFFRTKCSYRFLMVASFNSRNVTPFVFCNINYQVTFC